MKPGIKCPSCGLGRMQRVRRSVTSKFGKRCVVVPNVEVDECPRCGERLYDLAALAKIRKARGASSRIRAA